MPYRKDENRFQEKTNFTHFLRSHNSTAMPNLSIITPSWNGMPFLRECVESVLSQSFQDWEMLISDDGSTDESRTYLRSLNDSRVKLYEQEVNLGIFGNLNFLFQHATAPLSYILCQDDYFLPGGLEKVKRLWEKQRDDVAFVCFNRPPPTTGLLRLLPKTIHPREADLLFYLFGNIPGNLSNVSLRTDLPKRHGGFDQGLPFAGDFDFWSRVARKESFVQTRIQVTFVRRHENVASIHLNRRGELVKQGIQVVNQLYSNLEGRIPSWRLKLHGTLTYDAQQRHVGVMRLMRNRDPRYLRVVSRETKEAKFVFGPVLRWLIYFLSAGFHWGRRLGAHRVYSAGSRTLHQHRERPA